MAYKKKANDDELRLTRARADKVELEVAAKKGELIPLREVEREWVAMTLSFRNKMLAIPTAMATLLADMDKPAEIAATLKRVIDEALEELSIETVASADDSAAEAPEAPEEESEAKGG